MRTRNRAAWLLLAVFGVGCYVVVVWPSFVREPVGPPKTKLPETLEGGMNLVSEQFVGHTEADIAKRFGPPSHSWHGHYGLPDIEFQRKYPEAITSTYNRESGTLYLSFCKEGGRSVCFCSDWMPAGWVF